MQVANQATRYYAHVCYYFLRSGLTFLLTSTYRYVVRTVSSKLFQNSLVWHAVSEDSSHREVFPADYLSFLDFK